jgi:hypothetical protein
MDYQQLKPEDNFDKEIDQALLESSKNGHILLFISRDYLASSWCNKEMEIALNLSINEKASILPIIIDENLHMSEFPILNNIKYFTFNMKRFEIEKKELLKALNKINI